MCIILSELPCIEMFRLEGIVCDEIQISVKPAEQQLFLRTRLLVRLTRKKKNTTDKCDYKI